MFQVDENDEVVFINDGEHEPVTSAKETLVSDKEVPRKYKGYEELLNIDENYHDDVQLPKDIHGNVRALQYTLDHPLIFTDQSTRPRPRKKHEDVVNINLFLASPRLASPRQALPRLALSIFCIFLFIDGTEP